MNLFIAATLLLASPTVRILYSRMMEISRSEMYRLPMFLFTIYRSFNFTKNLRDLLANLLECDHLKLKHIPSHLTIWQVNAFTPAISTTNRYANKAVLAAEAGSAASGPPYSGPATKPILDSIMTPSDMDGLSMRDLKQVNACHFKIIICTHLKH